MNNNIPKKELFSQWQREGKKNVLAQTMCNTSKEVLKHRSKSSTKPPASTSASSLQKNQPICIKLAEESMSSEIDSDSSTYDSANEHSTDRCRDTDDTDGYIIEEIEEYELAYTSSSEDLYTNGSSSGTDDIVELEAHAIFDPSSNSSDQFEIFADDADTEQSDAPTDPELGRADYWTCIKCKNRKNNPLYRFCEKCFQIRKTHFPPRPKQQKKRLARLKDANGNEHKASSDSASSSCMSASEDKIDGRSSQNSNVDSVANTGKFLSKPSIPKRHVSHQDSARGLGSCCSSQELSPDEQQSPTPHSKPNYLDACNSSQETYCSEIERIVDSKNKTNLPIFESNYPNSQESVYPTSSQVSTQLSTQLSTEISISSTSTTNNTNAMNHGCPVAPSSSISSGDFAPTFSPIDSNAKNFTLNEIAIAMNGNEGTVAPKKKRPKKRKFSMPEYMAMDSDEDNDTTLIANSSKKSKTTSPVMEESLYGMCIICLTHPKDAAFVHNRVVHVSCCYQCASKVWNKRKRCPVCNSQAKNVLKIFVH